MRSPQVLFGTAPKADEGVSQRPLLRYVDPAGSEAGSGEGSGKPAPAQPQSQAAEAKFSEPDIGDTPVATRIMPGELTTQPTRP